MVQLMAVCHFYHVMYNSAKRGIAIACHLCVCLSVTLVDQEHIGLVGKSSKLIPQTISPTPSLFVAQTPSTYSQENMGKFGGTRGGVGKIGMLEHKSSNISETKVTMEGL